VKSSFFEELLGKKEKERERGMMFLTKSDFLLGYGASKGFATMVVESNC